MGRPRQQNEAPNVPITQNYIDVTIKSSKHNTFVDKAYKTPSDTDTDRSAEIISYKMKTHRKSNKFSLGSLEALEEQPEQEKLEEISDDAGINTGINAGIDTN